jgi:short-subunit dehydrogenase
MKRPGPVIVIVGASSGIGRATALAFAKQSRSRLVLAARNGQALEELAEQCRRLGGSALVVPTDVSVAAEVEELVGAAVRAHGRIDVWVGAASVAAYGLIEETPTDAFRQQTETNYLGWVYSAKAVLPVFRTQGAGQFILIGSIYSKISSPLMSGYLASKHAAWGFTETLRQELKGSGISVSVVLPATIDTPFYQHAGNYTGRKVHAMPPVVAPERVSRAVLRLTRHPRNQVVVGQLQRTLIGLHAMSPCLFDSVVRFGLFHVATRSKAVPETDGNLFVQSAEPTTVDGGWRWSPARRLLVVAGTAAAVWTAVRSLHRER